MDAVSAKRRKSGQPSKYPPSNCAALQYVECRLPPRGFASTIGVPPITPFGLVGLTMPEVRLPEPLWYERMDEEESFLEPKVKSRFRSGMSFRGDVAREVWGDLT